MSTAFLKALAERALKTFAQTLGALLGANAVDILTVPWGSMLSVAAGASLLSVLTSIASSGWGSDSPSLGGEKLDEGAPVGEG